MACGKATAAKRYSQNWNEWFWQSCLGKSKCSKGMPGEHFPLAAPRIERSERSARAQREGGGNAVVASYASIASKADLLAADAARDIFLCGRSLHVDAQVRADLASAGAHEPTPTPYFVLEELLGKLGLTANDHLLDVGCGTGRVLAYAASQLPCRATGVEFDARLANIASSWAASSPQLNVIAGSVLDISLAPYTCFYLFNPFDTRCSRASSTRPSARRHRPSRSSTCPITGSRSPTRDVPAGGSSVRAAFRCSIRLLVEASSSTSFRSIIPSGVMRA